MGNIFFIIIYGKIIKKKIVIIIFAFNRCLHVKNLLISLAANKKSLDLPIVCFIDGPRSKNDFKNIYGVKKEIHKFTKVFKNLKIKQRSKNLGCKENIISGISECFEEFNSAIILEDDLVLDKFFIDYMLEALEKYESKKKVFHISGYSYLDINSQKAVFTRLMNCWGWATWADRWAKLNTDSEELISTFSKNDIYQFNIEGSHNFFRQIIENKFGILETWAIFWYATIFKSNGLCLMPLISLVINKGNDGSGERFGNQNVNEKFASKLILDFPLLRKEDSYAFYLLKKYFLKRKNKFKNLLLSTIYSLPFELQKIILSKINKLKLKFYKVLNLK